MSKEKNTAVKSLVEQFEPLLPAAVNVIKEAVEGKPINAERLKTAKFVANSVKSGEIIEKEKRLVGLNERKFNLNVLNIFGSEEQKKTVKEAISKSLTSIKYLDD